MVMADLVAGRELDALVAEKVMGWHRKTYPEAYPPHYKHDGYTNRLTDYWYDSNNQNVAAAVDTHEMYEPGGQDEWSPSTDIAAAWQIVERWSVTLSHAVGPGLDWHCHLMQFDGTSGAWLNGDGHANTAPLAICRAVLAAVSH